MTFGAASESTSEIRLTVGGRMPWLVFHDGAPGTFSVTLPIATKVNVPVGTDVRSPLKTVPSSAQLWSLLPGGIKSLRKLAF